MPVDPMTGQMLPYGDENLDMMAMEEMMGGAPMGGGMGLGMGGDMNEMVPVMVPAWTVPAVEELVAILSEGEMGGDPMMDAPMGGGMDPMIGDPMAGGMAF